MSQDNQSEEALLKDVAETENENPHGLGRLYLRDDRDNDFPMSAHIMDEGPLVLPAYKYYTPGPILDQGQTSKCTGYTGMDFLTCSPIRQSGTTPDAIYCGAQANDPWPGDCTNPKYEGSTVRAAFKYLQQEGYIGSYIWAHDVAEVGQWILAGKGPVAFGTRWYQNMFHPDKNGVIKVDVNSGLAGGHAFLCIGYNSKTRMFKFQNSWSARWGAKGCFWLSADDLGLLLSLQGEAVTAIEIRKGVGA